VVGVSVGAVFNNYYEVEKIMELTYSFDCSNCLSVGAYDAGVTSVLSATQVLTDNIGYLRQDLNLILELSVFSSIMMCILLVVVLGAVWRQSRY
jgi:hypothetical protein